MIRINLLAVERERTKKRGGGGGGGGGSFIPAAHRVTIGASLILLATVLGVGWWFWYLQNRSSRVDEDIKKAEIEIQQLKSVLAQVQKFEARKGQLQQRVTIIEQLRKGQQAPVHVLDEISKSVPDRLWLNEVTQTSADFTMHGWTSSLSAVSDFVANLEATRWFKRPVEILDSQVQSDAKTGDLVKFSIKATFADPSAPAAPAGPGRGGAPAASPAAGRPGMM
jgi:type IV pilus assembly protein PilN